MRILQVWLDFIHRNKGWGWILLMIYVPAVIFPHEPVQVLVGKIADHYTHQRLYQGAAVFNGAIGLALTGMVVWRLRALRERMIIGVTWVITLLLIVGTWWALMANNVELVHFPQYFPEGMMLLALTESPVESIAWATIFGGLDECYQYWFLVAGKPVPYDFNDIYMDLLGAAAGVVFAMTVLHTERREARQDWWKGVLKRPGIVAVLGSVVIGALLWAAGVMTLYEAKDAQPHWFSLSRQTDLPFWFSAVGFLGPRTFHELSPVEGPILLLVTLAMYSLLDRRLRISVPPLSQ